MIYGEKKYCGREKIYTDVLSVTRDNVISVLTDAIRKHDQIASEITRLIKIEAGEQPLSREKKIRPDINIEVCDNVANEIVEFKTSYHYCNPITYIQRGDNDCKDDHSKSKKDSESTDDDGIYCLNEMLDYEGAPAKDQELGRFLQICGIGYQFVDYKRNWNGEGSAFDLVTIDPREAFVVYDNTIKHRKIMGVIRSERENADEYFYCFTADNLFIVRNYNEIVSEQKLPENKWEHESRSGEKNPFGIIPLVEFERSPDRTGVFERQIPEMDALNILVSDFANSVAQDTQSMWWGNDINFQMDENGNYITPSSGQWIVTSSGEMKNPKIQPLVIQTNYQGILNHINFRRDVIKQKCFVPKQSDPGGGSTGVAMSMSSGWQSAEVAASKEAQMISRGKMEIAELILKAISLQKKIKSSDPVAKLKATDVKPCIVRNRNYDLATKVNSMKTMIDSGIHPRHAMEVVELFKDTNLVYSDSEKYMKKYLESTYMKKEEKQAPQSGDNIHQLGNSPILDGMNTQPGGKNKDMNIMKARNDASVKNGDSKDGDDKS